VKAWHKAHHIHPHQLRHTAGTRVRRQSDIDTARVILGQKTLDAAEIHADIDIAKAKEFVGRAGRQ